ncbi:MAG: hypothetical protein QOF20_2997 [Acidimicrobiaceae bacterium]|jgi:hypothetical protein|nr:hypothetical protein [Acidimicrobiaceae bacterium]MDQ1366503.1 hypothetical protein [Acidimicrobiaceae bacterium]MDQ1370644.1 hypothetical protein [Acidimicrobiaceae bacterium]MDQ1378080.1 hypothetical protein [Acidimicrobiaceae bacterium]MDQ1415518.1 hypothetical protein [Acidimicrobiaceae bacterium]
MPVANGSVRGRIRSRPDGSGRISWQPHRHDQAVRTTSPPNRRSRRHRGWTALRGDGVHVSGGKIVEIDAIADPERVRRIAAAVLLAE